MRILSIGCPIPSPSVDNHSIANAPSIFDYDACILDPQAVSEQIDGIAAQTLDAKAPDGRTLIPGESGAFHFGLGELLRQRQLEFQQLLDRGGVLIVLAYPNVRHANVAAFPGLNRYSLIPAPADDPFSWPQLRPADGKDIRATDPQHAASGYIDDLAGRLRYRALFDLPPDSAGRVVARSVGGAAVAVEYRVGPGRLIALPPVDALAASQRKVFGAAILEMIDRLALQPDQIDAPVWVRRYDSSDAAAARDQLSEAEDELQQAQRRVTEAASLLADTTRFQSLLWQSQNRAFVDAARDAFRLLGYTITDADDGLQLRDGDADAAVELASVQDAVSDRLYLNLQQRIEEHFLRRKSRPKGIIVANGFRQTDPRTRRQPFPQALVDACETYGYALIPAEVLYELVTFASEAADEPELLEDIRRSIAETAGVLEVALEEEAEPTDSSDDVEDEVEPASPADNGAHAASAAPAEAG